MSIIQPENIIPLQRREIRLTAIIVLMDAFYSAQKTIIGAAELTLKEGTNPIKKSNTTYAAVNLKPRKYTAYIQSQYYFSSTTQITISPQTHSGTNPLNIPLTLQPKPGYPYPPQTTLLRGRAFSKETQLPLNNGQALALFNGKQLRTQIDIFGQFTFSLPNDTKAEFIDVVVHSDGYAQQHLRIQSAPKESVFFKIELSTLQNQTATEVAITSSNQSYLIGSALDQQTSTALSTGQSIAITEPNNQFAPVESNGSFRFYIKTTPNQVPISIVTASPGYWQQVSTLQPLPGNRVPFTVQLRPKHLSIIPHS